MIIEPISLSSTLTSANKILGELYVGLFIPYERIFINFSNVYATFNTFCVIELL